MFIKPTTNIFQNTLEQYQETNIGMTIVFAELEVAKIVKGHSYIRQKHTRLYLRSGPSDMGNHSHGRCVGSVWLCNPPDCDTLQAWSTITPRYTHIVISRIFQQAASTCRVREDDYLQILNLHYICDGCANSGWISREKAGDFYSEDIDPDAAFVWVAWGGRLDSRINFSDLTKTLNGHSVEKFYCDNSLRLREVTPKMIAEGSELDGKRKLYPLHPCTNKFWNKDDTVVGLSYAAGLVAERIRKILLTAGVWRI